MTSETEVTLAEDIMLVLFQPSSGTIAGENILFYVLGGALLADLSLRGYLQVGDSEGPNAKRLATIGAQPPGDALLRSAWEYLDEKPRRIQTVLAAIGPSSREPVLARLIARGDIEQSEGKWLFFKTQSLAEGETGRRASLLASLQSVLVDGVEPTSRVASLAALLSGSGSLHRLHPDIPWNSAVIGRAKELETGSWGASAAAEGVARTVTATVISNILIAAAVTPPR